MGTANGNGSNDHGHRQGGNDAHISLAADRMLEEVRAALNRFRALPPAERTRRLIVARLRRLLSVPRVSPAPADITARLPAAVNIRAPALRREDNVVMLPAMREHEGGRQ